MPKPHLRCEEESRLLSVSPPSASLPSSPENHRSLSDLQDLSDCNQNQRAPPASGHHHKHLCQGIPYAMYRYRADKCRFSPKSHGTTRLPHPACRPTHGKSYRLLRWVPVFLLYRKPPTRLSRRKPARYNISSSSFFGKFV